jgi:hypothetical protein
LNLAKEIIQKNGLLQTIWSNLDEQQAGGK